MIRIWQLSVTEGDDMKRFHWTFSSYPPTPGAVRTNLSKFQRWKLSPNWVRHKKSEKKNVKRRHEMLQKIEADCICGFFKTY